ncbi:OmpA family protein [Psychrobacter arenosus]|uniref:OmpA family protein n=1 Tax=Psychrobacter arenosus TaxID=256326 RepID=UPI00191B35DE|nr:OmpA family protein [Psychrobacter arenosus]
MAKFGKTKITTALLVIGGIALTGCQTKLTTIPNNDLNQANVPEFCIDKPIPRPVDENGHPLPVLLMGPLQLNIMGFFDFNSAKLDGDYANEIDKLPKYLAQCPNLPIVLLGHISEVEAANPQANNEHLGRKRAQTVKERLLNNGIAASRIQTYDCGMQFQIAPNDTDEGAWMNQRVFGWMAVQAESYVVNPRGLTGYQQRCEAFSE